LNSLRTGEKKKRVRRETRGKRGGKEEKGGSSKPGFFYFPFPETPSRLGTLERGERKKKGGDLKKKRVAEKEKQKKGKWGICCFVFMHRITFRCCHRRGGKKTEKKNLGKQALSNGE